MSTPSRSNVDQTVDQLLRTTRMINKYALVDIRCGKEDVTPVGGLLNLRFRFGGGKVREYVNCKPGDVRSLVLKESAKKVQTQSAKHLAQEDGPAWDALPDSVQTLFGLAHRFKLPNGKQHVIHIPGYNSIDSSALSLYAEPTIILEKYLVARYNGKLDRHDVGKLAIHATKQPNPAQSMISSLMAVIEDTSDTIDDGETTETDESSAEDESDESSERKELSAAQTLVASAKTAPVTQITQTTQTTPAAQIMQTAPVARPAPAAQTTVSSPALAGAEEIARQVAEQQAKWCESISTLYESCQTEVGAMEKALAQKKKELAAIGSIKDSLTPLAIGSTKKRGRGRPPGSKNKNTQNKKKTKPRA